MAWHFRDTETRKCRARQPRFRLTHAAQGRETPAEVLDAAEHRLDEDVKDGRHRGGEKNVERIRRKRSISREREIVQRTDAERQEGLLQKKKSQRTGEPQEQHRAHGACAAPGVEKRLAGKCANFF